MRGILIALVVLVAVVVGLGFYLGWFHVSTESANQKTNITVTVDQDQIKKDEKKAEEKLRDVKEKVKEKIASPGSKEKKKSTAP